MRSLVKTLATSLILDPQVESEAPPWVYTAAIHSSADLVSSMAGIACLTRELGFNRNSEAIYAKDCRSASYHADHERLAMTLTVECNPVRETVALAISGVRCEETYSWFQRVETALFGSC